MHRPGPPVWPTLADNIAARPHTGLPNTMRRVTPTSSLASTTAFETAHSHWLAAEARWCRGT